MVLRSDDGRGDDDHPSLLRSPTWSRTRAAPLPPGSLDISTGVLVRALLGNSHSSISTFRFALAMHTSEVNRLGRGELGHFLLNVSTEPVEQPFSVYFDYHFIV